MANNLAEALAAMQQRQPRGTGVDVREAEGPTLAQLSGRRDSLADLLALRQRESGAPANLFEAVRNAISRPALAIAQDRAQQQIGERQTQDRAQLGEAVAGLAPDNPRVQELLRARPELAKGLAGVLVERSLGPTPAQSADAQREERGLAVREGGLAETKRKNQVSERMAVAKFEQSQAEGGPFGSSLTGRALNTLTEYKRQIDTGETPSQEETDVATGAAHVLSRERFMTGPQGETVAIPALGVPEGFPVPGGVPGAPVAGQLAAAPSGPRLVMEGPEAKAREQAADQLLAITDLLRAAEEGGETITGAVGTGKALLGGAARQFGLPVGEEAAQLDRRLEALKLALAPMLTREGKLSDEDRRRIDKVVGSLGALTDKVELADALAQVRDMILSGDR